ncbi:phosphate regulon sensor histidine kinase PhoR [Salinisphaera orenii]|uniref:phosphate regulon sensor histidine kinase PhoR n=1 Tax=Salinisphaera orenii TaxID=856731 RepID=UPI000DBE5E80
MKAANPWRRELLILAGWLALAAAIGWLSGNTVAGFLLALVLYLILQLVYTYQLYQWLVSDRIEPAYGVGIWQEVYAELYRLRQRNRRRKQRLGRIVSEFQASTAALPDAAVVLDDQLAIAWFNDAARRLLGLRLPDDRGQRLTNLIRDPELRAYLGGQSDDNAENIEISSPVDVNTVLSIQLVPYGNGQRLLIGRDVSQRRRVEAMRRDFVANASHELRTPLTVVRGYLEMMDSGAGDDAALRGWQSPIGQMRAEADRMDRMIDDLLELARLESAPESYAFERIEVAALIDRIVRQQPQQGAEIDAGDLASIELYGDARRLESIVSNLLANARRHTPAGGQITVSWQPLEDGAELAVTDTGEGIAAEHIPRLTERFYRADAGRSSARGGTGLGLAIVKHALKCHDAELSITSSPAKGSRFACRFPSARCVSPAAIESSSDADAFSDVSHRSNQ